MLRVIRQLWVFSRFISEIQSSTAAPGYRQRRRKRKNSGTCWQTPAYKERSEKKKPAGIDRLLDCAHDAHCLAVLGDQGVLGTKSSVKPSSATIAALCRLA